MSQEHLALLCNMDRNYLGIETGRVNLTHERIYELEKMYAHCYFYLRIN